MKTVLTSNNITNLFLTATVTNINLPGGIVFTDIPLANYSARFYRAVVR